MPKFSLKDGNTLQYKKGKVYYNENEVDINTGLFKDNDGYIKKIIPNATLTDYAIAVQDVDEKGTPIKHNYIGGTTKKAREKYWKKAPIIRHAVDSIADKYGINPNILKERLSLEGFVDRSINENNEGRNTSDYKILHETYGSSDGFGLFGLDDVGTMIKEGKIKLINENYETQTNLNEKGRLVNSVAGRTTLDNMGAMAATLKYFRNEAKKDFPNASNAYLDKAASIYYNRGVAGGYKYLKNKKK